ncbi:hypothetical protein PUNSTDRAFT_68531 [Punctularia strigosozonata HHB-11173 SS5]|uniref:uncharacterized protein n=1 Tax=Punctularia strigosozonata (strain HHB-11173) TaxID=741275 RepID=UPI0004418483|nr:uncharacterized protein PUNSTDRAFT_68531 [Punctularia strigosozonata HHB-11173 SS5]EIN08479.1 hypothetical protein PUNSTDRAFT_68531 [Punctularia strigosozonata HHB-11173 SS5]
MLHSSASPSDPIGEFAEALSLYEQFCRQSDVQAAKKCIEIYKELLRIDAATTDEELPVSSDQRCYRYHLLIHLANTLVERFSYADDRCDLGFATRYGKEALSMCRKGQIACPTVLALHARILDINAPHVAHASDRVLAESLCREALALCKPGNPLKAKVQRILSEILLNLFVATGTATYREEATDLQRRALEEVLPSQEYEKWMLLRSLGSSLRLRHGSLGQLHDLDGAISVLREALQLCPDTHIERGQIIRSLVAALYTRCTQSDAFEGVDEAIDLGRSALRIEEGRPNGHPRSITLNVVGNLLALRHQITLSDGRDIDDCIHLRREALRLILPDAADRWGYMDNLADTLRERFAWNGEIKDLEEAIQLGRQAVDAIPENHTERFRPARDLADMLTLRFTEAGDIADLDEALVWDRRAIMAIPLTHMEYGYTSMPMIRDLCMRFEILEALEDVEEAIALSKRTLNVLTANSVNKPLILHGLSKALVLRGSKLHNLEDIHQAIEILEPVSAELAQRTDGQECAHTLSKSYLARFHLIKVSDDAVRALNITMDCLAALKHGRRERFQYLIDAAELYAEPFAPYHNLLLSARYLTEALSDDHRDVRSRIQGVARVLTIIQTHDIDILSAECSFSTASGLLGAYVQATGLLSRVPFFGLHLHSRLQSLRIGQSIAIEGAAFALRLSRPETALEILEQGRAIFWTHTLRLRSPFDAVPKELRDELLSLARQLEHVTDASQYTEDAKLIETEAARRRQQSEDFDSLLQKVRALPGLERVLLPDEFPVLCKAAERGPVVVLVSSPFARHAVIMTPSGEVISIALGITDVWLVEAGAVWIEKVKEARSNMGVRLKVSKVSTASRPRYNNAEEVLRRLWIDVVHPVLETLGLQPCIGRVRPRIWWCPTGPFVHLPIHAAGAEGTWSSDYVVSSYTPTLGALLTARSSYTPVAKQDARALIVAVPRSELPMWADLPGASDESSAVRASLPKGAAISLTSPANKSSEDDSELTMQLLIDKLPQATILHLACHGYQDPENPLKSGFVMRDEMLTIEKLVPTPLPNAFMAFLSACETAKGDKDQPDQTVHLAATMLFAGFKSVIATLWSMEDVDGPMMAESIYRDIFHGDAEHFDPDDIAYALDAAVGTLRRAHPEPSRWAPYIHLGI